MITRRSRRKTILFAAGLILMVVTGGAYGQPSYGQAALPPIAAPLIREGELAMKLLPGLGLGLAPDEFTAESRLGDAGIMPRNGWMADYPVTPDIIGELRRAVSDAADAGLLSMSRDQALGQMDYVAAGLNTSTPPYGSEGAYSGAPPDAQYYPDAAAMSNYYYTEGPPVYTYFVPPDDYYNLYSYVPYPFWSSGFYFPGYFILRDFHRTIRVHGRPYYCSNHFRDRGSQRVAVVDPVARLGQAGASSVGVPYAGTKPASSLPRTGRAGISRPHTRGLHSAASPAYQTNTTGGATVYRNMMPSYQGVTAASPSYGRTAAAAPQPGAAMASVSYHSGPGFSGPPRSLSGPSGGGRIGAPPARGGGHR